MNHPTPDGRTTGFLAFRIVLAVLLLGAGTGCRKTVVIVQQPTSPSGAITPANPLPGSPSPTLPRTTGGADTAGMVPVTIPVGFTPPGGVATTTETQAQVALNTFTVQPGPPQKVVATVNGAQTEVDATALVNDIKGNRPKYDQLVKEGKLTQAQLDALAAFTPTPAANMAKTVGGADTAGMVQVQTAAATTTPAATGTVTPAPGTTVPVAIKDFTFTAATAVAGATPGVPSATVLLSGVNTPVDVTTLQADAKADTAKYQKLVTETKMTQVQLDALLGSQRATVLAAADANGLVRVKKPDGTEVQAKLTDFTVATGATTVITPGATTTPAQPTINVNLGGTQTPVNVSVLQADVRSQGTRYADFVKRSLMTQELLTALSGSTNYAYGPSFLTEAPIPSGG